MFDRCRQLQISLNLKKCIFDVPFGTLLGHIVCKEGVCVDLAKVVVIINIPPLTSVKKLRSTLNHIRYYHRFIHNYATIIMPMEKILKKFERFTWSDECEAALNVLKEKLANTPILVYLD